MQSDGKIVDFVFIIKHKNQFLKCPSQKNDVLPSSELPAEVESVAEADMGQWGAPEIWGHGEAGPGGPASLHESDALIQIMQMFPNTFNHLTQQVWIQ